MKEYEDFLSKKQIIFKPSGFDVEEINPILFDWQKILVKWALKKGKAAIFADCGLGKTPMQLEWAHRVNTHTKSPVIIFAPLAVSLQTQREGIKFGIDVNVAKSMDDIKHGINISNYEKIHKFDPSFFGGIVLDESSILKSFSGKYRNELIELYKNTPYKLACTATPSPNDFIELGNHSEFLGVMTRSEMLSMFFINDTANTGTWRLKGHVKSNLFWKWLASWSVMLRFPSDIGFNDDGFILPELKIIEHIIKFTGRKETLFVEEAATLTERRAARKESIQERVNLAADIINKSDETWLVGCNLNDESKMLTDNIKDAIEVTGSNKQEFKESAMLNFQDDKIKCLVSKPRICGFGMNFQKCHNMAFVGLSDSYEQFYQMLRRCYRFGQSSVVNAHIIISEKEGSVLKNIKRKSAEMDQMYAGMVYHMKELTKQELIQARKTQTTYNPQMPIQIPNFLISGAINEGN